MTQIVSIALAASLFVSLTVPAAAAGLDPYLWKSRPVVVFAPSEKAPQAVDQLKRFAAAREMLAERDMPVLFVTVGSVRTVSGQSAREKLDAEALRKAFGVAANGFAVVLVGKDGGEKLRAEQPIEAEKLTALVDTMPMRAQETR